MFSFYLMLDCKNFQSRCPRHYEIKIMLHIKNKMGTWYRTWKKSGKMSLEISVLTSEAATRMYSIE